MAATTRMVCWGMVFLACLTINAGAQNCSKWGPDSLTTIQQVSLYREYFHQGLYQDALPYWRYCFQQAPGVRLRLYVDGEKMYETLLQQHYQDKAKAQLLADTLMMIYDQRIRCWGKPEIVLPRKAYAMYRYQYGTPEDLGKLLEEIIQLRKDDIPAYLMEPILKNAIDLENSGKGSQKQVMERYQILQKVIANHPDNPYQKASLNLDRLLKNFLKDCETAIQFFEQQLEKTPNDTSLQQLAFETLVQLSCTESELLYRVATQCYERKKEPGVAIFLARKAKAKGSLELAAQYFEDGIQLEMDTLKKAGYLMEFALFYRYDQIDYPKSRQLALQAAALRPTWGEPYLFIGDLYASSREKCQDDGLEGYSVYWAAVDKYVKARQIDPSVANEANQKTQLYEGHYPEIGTLFMKLNTGKTGGPFRVGCWINETTTIRARPE